MDAIVTHLAQDHFFSKLDLSKGYWQVAVEENCKHLIAFATPSGLFQFNVMPFGLVNAPATFNRMMRILLKGLRHVDCYLDDILIHTPTWEQHLNVLSAVFKRLREANLTAKLSKCCIAKQRVEFLGHVVGKGKLEPQLDKVEKIKAAPRPQTKKQLRSFLGLTGYYRVSYLIMLR
ncbi:putative retrovirus-related Pol polyprotein from transposon [Apostichopus japonicus]|uniref:Putative retrovirus-related Pol polyprotein from transposon n=1 Tax=Stichopus japonicus TaxID=307972 RepID=A0A2G8LPR1_STIJA|nr:putative retrovirus-related Pol polyprotein from transposon [Apostichopus japonicus]